MERLKIYKIIDRVSEEYGHYLAPACMREVADEIMRAYRAEVGKALPDFDVNVPMPMARNASNISESSTERILEGVIKALHGYPNVMNQMIRGWFVVTKLFDRLPAVYEVHARKLGKSVDQLTTSERQEAMLSNILSAEGK